MRSPSEHGVVKRLKIGKLKVSGRAATAGRRLLGISGGAGGV